MSYCCGLRIPARCSTTRRFHGVHIPLFTLIRHSDQTIWDALEAVQMKVYVTTLPGALDAPVSEGGNNLSVSRNDARGEACAGEDVEMKFACRVHTHVDCAECVCWQIGVFLDRKAGRAGCIVTLCGVGMSTRVSVVGGPIQDTGPARRYMCHDRGESTSNAKLHAVLSCVDGSLRLATTLRFPPASSVPTELFAGCSLPRDYSPRPGLR